MRIVPLTLPILLCAISAFASEIREFDLKTLQRLGNELVRVSQTANKGATTPERKRAKQSAVGALEGKLYGDVRYQYVVLDDPDGSGFLVYALATNKKASQQITGGHFRVTVSVDGAKVERIDALSRSIISDPPAMPAGATQVSIATSQLVSNLPVETFVYTSYVYRLPIFVATPDRKVWAIANGNIVRVDNKDSKTAAEVLSKKK